MATVQIAVAPGQQGHRMDKSGQHPSSRGVCEAHGRLCTHMAGPVQGLRAGVCAGESLSGGCLDDLRHASTQAPRREQSASVSDVHTFLLFVVNKVECMKEFLTS